MKHLEDIIRSHRSEFDDMEPPEGHFERFDQKLRTYNRRKRLFNWNVILKAAVVAVLVVLSGLWVSDRISEQQTPESLALEKVSPEVKEAHFYYSSLMEKKYEQIKQFDFRDEEQKEMLLNELQDMNSIYVNIKEDLRTNPNDPRVINALIRHYQMKLEVMNQILDQLQSINEQTKSKEKNDESYETTET
ncbi:MAG: hypothetical protein V5A59_15020 [Bacteroidales bacterium]